MSMTVGKPRVREDAVSEAEASELLGALPSPTRGPARPTEASGQVPLAKEDWIPGLPAHFSALFRFAVLLQERCGVPQGLAPASVTAILYAQGATLAVHVYHMARNVPGGSAAAYRAALLLLMINLVLHAALTTLRRERVQ